MQPNKDYILKLIAEGYFKDCAEDRYVIVHNPDYNRTGWEDPFIVYDIADGEEED